MSATRAKPPIPELAELQHWTWVAGRAQQLLMEAGIPLAAPEKAAAQVQDFWSDYLALLERFAVPGAGAAPTPEKDRRFAAAAWREHPLFDWIRQSYALVADHLLRGVDQIEGVDERTRAQWRFATRGFVDAMSPSNFALTNPEVIERTIETRGENLLAGLHHLLADLQRGQVTHSKEGAFTLGEDLATTPGQVVKRTPFYELIQYSPATAAVLATPLVIFPPWINRFYILDLTREKSFIRWAVEQGVTVFVVSWRSADSTMAEVTWDDYVAAQIDAIDTVRALLDVPAVHTVGYCVAGTTLAATLALLAAKGEEARVASATFLTAQVDFSQAGELRHFVDDEQLRFMATLSPQGFLDGRYLAATFNLLRGRDLIWNYVTQNYLLGKEHVPFDLLHWNGDVTNLPADWHLAYLTDLYRDNRLAKGEMTIAGVPIDLSRVTTPSYVQAGREDHIAPAESVWKLTAHFRGPLRFVLAGSGHIAGVVNPPAAGKYQHWINETWREAGADSLESFVAGAREVKGSWWPDWAAWLRALAPDDVPATGARVPGAGTLAAIEPAPGRYVRTR